MKNTTFKLVKSSFETKGKITLAESTSFLSLLQKAISHFEDSNLKSLVMVDNWGKVKYYWKKETPESDLKMVEGIGA